MAQPITAYGPQSVESIEATSPNTSVAGRLKYLLREEAQVALAFDTYNAFAKNGIDNREYDALEKLRGLIPDAAAHIRALLGPRALYTGTHARTFVGQVRDVEIEDPHTAPWVTLVDGRGDEVSGRLAGSAPYGLHREDRVVARMNGQGDYIEILPSNMAD